MANLSWDGFSMTFEHHLLSSRFFSLLQISFLLCSCGWRRLVLQSEFEYDSFIAECSAFLIREGKAPSCFISQRQRIWISLELRRQPVCWLSTIGETAIWFEIAHRTTPSDLAVNSSVYDAENWYFFAESWIIHSHTYLSVSAPVEITYYPSTEMFGADGDVQ